MRSDKVHCSEAAAHAPEVTDSRLLNLEIVPEGMVNASRYPSIAVRTSPTPTKSTSTRSPGAIGNCRVNDPLMMISPAWMPRPNSCSFRASQTTEFSGLPSTASPRPVATVSPLIRTVAATVVQRKIAERHRIAQHHGLLLRVVRHRHRDLRREVAARLDDLQRRIHRVDRAAHSRHIDLAAQRLTDPQAQLRLEARPDQLVAAEHVPRRPAFQDAAEHRLVEAELLLDRHRRQPHLPADLPLARGDATRR